VLRLQEEWAQTTATGVSLTGVTGISGTSQLGTETATGTSEVVISSGVAGTSALGNETVTGVANVSPTGLAGTSGLGSVSTITDNRFGITGFSATSALGTLGETTGGATADLTSLVATGELNLVLVWGEVVPGVTTNWQEVA